MSGVIARDIRAAKNIFLDVTISALVTRAI
jgi:hypothetical protein